MESNTERVDMAVDGICRCRDCNSTSENGDIVRDEITRLRRIASAAKRVMNTPMTGVDPLSEMARSIFGLTFVMQEEGEI